MPNNPAFSFLLRNGTFETLIDRKRSYGKDHCTVAYKVGDIKEPHSFNHYIYFNNPVCNRTRWIIKYLF